MRLAARLQTVQREKPRRIGHQSAQNPECVGRLAFHIVFGISNRVCRLRRLDSSIAPVEDGVPGKIEQSHQQEPVANGADIPTTSRFGPPKNCIKKTDGIQTMPEQKNKKRRAGRKEYCGPRNSPMQFIHPADPSRQAPSPKRKREEFSSLNSHTRGERQLQSRVMENDIGNVRDQGSPKQPSIPAPIHPPRVFLVPHKNFAGNV